MTDRMKPGTSSDNAEPAKNPKTLKTTDGSQDCSCAEARAHLEAFLDRECTADQPVKATTCHGRRGRGRGPAAST